LRLAHKELVDCTHPREKELLDWLVWQPHQFCHLAGLVANTLVSSFSLLDMQLHVF
jgi:hypothetical protein